MRHRLTLLRIHAGWRLYQLRVRGWKLAWKLVDGLHTKMRNRIGIQIAKGELPQEIIAGSQHTYDRYSGAGRTAR